MLVESSTAAIQVAETPERVRPSTQVTPRTPQETGLPFLFLVELVAKTLYVRGVLHLNELSQHLKLPAIVIDPLIHFMRFERLCEVSGVAGGGINGDLTYRLTDLGRTRAVEWLARNAYAGPAPVTLAAYSAQVEIDSVKHMRTSRASMNYAFGEIVMNSKVRDQLGAAMNSHEPMYLHGLAGSGKTFLAEHLASALSGAISVPFAVYVDGEVINIYDPAVHDGVTLARLKSENLRTRTNSDARWVQSKRPAVLTGGELTLEMLELKFDATNRFYHAPPHLKANNGILVIDDLGRQRCSPAELLNRWIVPLDRKVDFLTLHTGYKFKVPFDVIVVFSSNLPPGELNDASFLRRIAYKIHIGPLSEAQYQVVFARACEQFGVPYCADTFDFLLQEHHYPERQPLLACVPRDLLAQVRDAALFEGVEPRLTPALLDWAWNNYFGEPAIKHTRELA